MLAGLVTVLLLGGSVAASAEPASTEDPLWLSPEMRAWVHLQVPAAGRPEVRLERLLDALLQPGALGLREQTLATVTAAEAFTSRHADCTGFAHLFVALARELQVPAFFLLFEDIETYQRGNHLRIASAHLAAGFGPQGRVRVYDFGGVNPGSSSHPHRRISDQTAAAVYRSNRGAQLLAAGSIAAAIQQLRQAVTLDPTLGHDRRAVRFHVPEH